MNLVNKNHSQRCMSLPSECHPYVLACTRTSSVCYSYVVRISLVCTSMSSKCQSYVLYVIRMSLVCTRMSSVRHLYVLVRHPYVTCIYSYVTRMSLVCGFYHEPKWIIFVIKVSIINWSFSCEIFFWLYQPNLLKMKFIKISLIIRVLLQIFLCNSLMHIWICPIVYARISLWHWQGS